MHRSDIVYSSFCDKESFDIVVDDQWVEVVNLNYCYMFDQNPVLMCSEPQVTLLSRPTTRLVQGCDIFIETS